MSQDRGLLTKHRDQAWYDISVPCRTACPAGTDVPGYLEAVREGDFSRSYQINLKDNIFPAVLGRICTRPCEPACRHGREGQGEPVAICFAKRSADAFRTSHKPTLLEPFFPPTGKRIAIVGAGPAGLGAARELTLFGHSVTVFEKHDKPGGMMTQGIPEFRLPQHIVDLEIEQVLIQGIELHCGVEIGRDVTLGNLTAGYDAVIVSTGAHIPHMPEFHGNGLEGVQHGFDFIRDVNTDAAPTIGESVVVIGGGFTAVDCAQAAHYLGAESVDLVYRRSEEDMRCSGQELARLREEGITLTMHTVPRGFKGAGRVSQVELASARNGASPWLKDTQTVLLATGQRRCLQTLDPVLGQALERRLATGSSNPQPVVSNIFVCGDAAHGAQSIIDAIGDARRIARTVDANLMGRNRFVDGIMLKDRKSTGRDRSHNAVPRQDDNDLAVEQRSLDRELSSGLSPDDATREAWRCYMCNQKVEIDNERCISCGLCTMVMPVEDCIVQLKAERDADGNVRHRVVHDFESFDALVVDQDRCIRCDACRESCPVDCISLQSATPVMQPESKSRTQRASRQPN